MQSSLLTTKPFFPLARPTLVPHPRLTARVSEGLTRPLTLISAPTGFGKPTLLSERRASVGSTFPLAWLSLDSDDNNPMCFLAYLVATLGNLKLGFSEMKLALLDSPQPPSSQAILTSLINDLSEFEDPFALVLDAHPLHREMPGAERRALALGNPQINA